MKAAVLIVAAALYAAPAAAEDAPMLSMYNQYCSEMSSAAPLEGVPTVHDSPYGGKAYRYKAAPGIHVAIMTDGTGTVKGCGVICLAGSDTAEFLAQAVASCYYIGGIESGLDCYEPILYQFMECRAGRTPEPEKIGKFVCSTKTADDGALIFFAADPHRNR